MSVATKGLLLSLVTAFMWGILPLFLIVCLEHMNSASITFYRFLSAGAVLLILLAPSGKLKYLQTFTRKQWALAFAATLLLVINYVTNVMGLEYLSPGSVQLLMQLAPLALLTGGLVFYNEVFNRFQLVGVVVLIIGLLLFFSERLPDIASSQNEDPIGIAIIAFSALAWASYALLQKGLLAHYSSNQINTFLYLIGAVFLIPMTDFTSITLLSGWQIFALVFCCVNTLIAYGAFAEALRIWDASRVSAVLSLAPLVTLISNHIASEIWPDTFNVPEMSVIAYVGAGVVIIGSMTCALARGKSRAKSI